MVQSHAAIAPLSCHNNNISLLQVSLGGRGQKIKLGEKLLYGILFNGSCESVEWLSSAKLMRNLIIERWIDGRHINIEAICGAWNYLLG